MTMEIAYFFARLLALYFVLCWLPMFVTEVVNAVKRGGYVESYRTLSPYIHIALICFLLAPYI